MTAKRNLNQPKKTGADKRLGVLIARGELLRQRLIALQLESWQVARELTEAELEESSRAAESAPPYQKRDDKRSA